MTHINWAKWRDQEKETRDFEFQTVFIAKKMKNICKFTIDSDDEVVHIYSVNKDGVVVISDDDDTPVQRQSSGITNAGKFNNSLQSTPDAKTNAPSSTVNEKSRSPPARHRQVSIEPKKDQHVSQSQNMIVTIKVSELAKAEDKGMCLNREENVETQHSSHLKMIKPTSSRHSHHSFDSNEKKTESTGETRTTDDGLAGAALVVARDSEAASCSTRVNGKRKIPKSLMDVKLSKRKRARPGWRNASSSSQTSPPINLPSLEKLSSFSHIIFIDLDNWNHITTAMYSIPKNIFVWGFCGGDYNDKRSASFNFRTLLNEQRFFRHPKCSKVKNAADFALCVQVARLDLQLPIHIAFTILSGDKSFSELKNQLKCSSRQIHIINPHNEDPHILHGLLASIADT